MPIVPIGGPPPPKDSLGQDRPPPRPPKPRRKPVIVRPHCAEPSREFHSCLRALQIWPSTACRRLVGLSRFVTRFNPVPLKKLSRQLSDVTLFGGLIELSSAWMRPVMPFAAAWVMTEQPTLPVVAVWPQAELLSAVIAIN